MEKGLDLDPETPLDGQVYLGCNQRKVSLNEELFAQKQELFPRITNPSITSAKEPTLLDSEQETARGDALQGLAFNANHELKREKPGEVEAWNYDMAGQCAQCAVRYCQLANVKLESLKKVSTPCRTTINLLQPTLKVRVNWPL